MSNIEFLDQFSKIKVLADPRRLKIIQLLMAKPASLTQLGQMLGQHPARIRHHIQKLEEAGLIELDEITITRGVTEKFYKAKAGAYLLQKMILPEDSTRKTIIISGSHDLAVDMLCRDLETNFNILTLPNGSLNGMIALRQGLCHLCGSHLKDADGEYNKPYVRHLLSDHDPIMITLADRQQGLMMAADNPKGITGLEDLPREDIRIINRQPGSGTRQWLDTHLKEKGIPASKINGYSDSVKTHTEVARMVASGKADVGLGLQASAMQFQLAFIPLFLERYDLITDRLNLETSSPILDHIQSSSFRKVLSNYPGYENTHTGEQIFI